LQQSNSTERGAGQSPEFHTPTENSMSSQIEIRQRVTQQIVAALESGGIPPWKRPWSSAAAAGTPRNAATLSRYSGVNIPILNMSALANGWSGRYWATYQQWQGLECQVRPRPAQVRTGEWGTRIVFCKQVEKTKQAEGGDEREERYWVLREFVVFAAEQVDGVVAERLIAQPKVEPAQVIDFTPAEDVLRTSGADIRFGGDRAYYCPDRDYVRLPTRTAFDDAAGFYGTALHELVHWTGHPSRLDRLTRNAKFGSDAYAFEELCAEIGAAYLCSELAVPQADDLGNSAAYLASWVRVLRNDPHAIFRAATMGSRAADMLLAFPGQAGGNAEPALAA
jgi:antirestriction protein ArdC